MAAAIYRQQKALSHFPPCWWIDWLLMIKNCLIESGPPRTCQFVYVSTQLPEFTSTEEISTASVRKRTIPTERPQLVSEVSATFFANRGCHVVSVTNPYGRILGFLDRSSYSFFQVAS
jgi:hypothetical protein